MCQKGGTLTLRASGVSSNNECSAEVGQRPLTRRYALAYNSAYDMRPTRPTREKSWRGWTLAKHVRLAERLDDEESFTEDSQLANALYTKVPSFIFLCKPKSNTLAKY